MAITNFIPEIWSAAILERLTAGSVLSNLADRRYEGELRYGAKLHIPGMEPVTVKTLPTAASTIEPDEIADTGTELLIDQRKYAAIYINDIDRAQASRNLDIYAENMAISMLEDRETYLATQLVAGDTAPVTGAAPASFADAWDKVLDLGAALTDKKVGKANRKLLVNGKFERQLLSNDGKLTSANTSGSNDGLRNATIGRLGGFDVINCPYLDQTTAIAVAFVPETLAFAGQLEQPEALRPSERFSDLLRTLHVYGGKVIRPELVRVFKATA